MTLSIVCITFRYHLTCHTLQNLPWQFNLLQINPPLGWGQKPFLCVPTALYICSGGLDYKEYACNVGDLGLIPGLGRSPGGGHGNPLQYSCLENPHGQRSLVGFSPWGHKESDMTERRSLHYKGREPHFVHHCLSGTWHTTYLECNTYFLLIFFFNEWDE